MTQPESPLKRLLRYARPHRSRVVVATTHSIVNKIFDLAPPVLIGMAVDIVVEKEESFLASLGVVDVIWQLTILGVLTVIIWGMESIFEYAYQVAWRNLAQTLQHELRLDTYRHTQSLEMAFFEERSTGGLMSVLNDDVNQLERFLDGGANDVIQVGTTVVVIGAAFFAISPTVAVLAFLPIPIILWGSFRFQKKIAPRYADVRERVGYLNALLSNNLSGIATIKSFTGESREAARVEAESASYQETNRGAIRLSSAFSPLIRMAIVLGFTATLLVGGYLTLEGAMAVGSYSVLIFMTQRLLWPLTRLGATFDLYQRAMASTNRVLDLLDTPEGIEDGEVEIASFEGRVQLEAVEFAYRGGAVPVLHGIDMDIPAGSDVAIVGSTGAGKTSFVKLLLRFYDVTGGAIRIDGRDLREMTKASLRRNIGLVSQDVFLFEGTVKENILYGCADPDVSMTEIIEAARVAEAHDFIERLPEGYETRVGERGQKLSGGQRQRISIARAVLKDPPILVLDEATSSVDNETEAAIQRSMEIIAKGRTTIVIAHRLSTVRNADTIFVIDAGLIKESGTHDELLAEGGLYARLWAVQTGEPLVSDPG